MKTQENSNLDFMRALAVLFVVAGHALHFFGIDQIGALRMIELGGLGVELFFVHTALVLMMSLERQAGQARMFASFMLRRCFRIYPLAIFAVAFVAAFGIPQASLSRAHFAGMHFDWTDLLANVALVQSFSNRSPILGPTWSLAYELQMYLLLPAIFVFLSRGGVRRDAIVWISAIVVAVVGVHFLGAAGNLAVFLPCFVPGVIAYRLLKRTNSSIPAFVWPMALVVISAAYLSLGDSLSKSWIVCSIVGLAIPAFGQLRATWIVAPAKAIAKYSYGVYLAHFAILWFAFEKLGALPTAAKCAIFGALLVAVPFALFHAIEEPMIKLGRRAVDDLTSKSVELETAVA